VVHTFSSFIDPAFVSPRKGAYRTLEKVEAVDPYTVRFTLKEPFGSFPIQLVMPVVPKGAGSELRDWPIGTGPYKFVGFAVDDHVTLAANPEYFRGKPANGGVVLKVIPDEIMRALELRKGTVDMVVNDLSPDVVHQLAEERAVKIVESPGTDYAYVGVNMRDPVLQDRRVRHALGYAIDRQAIVDHLRRGLARPAVGILPPASWAFEPDVFQFTHNPAKASALLEDAGYRDPDGSGPQPRLRLSLKVSTNEFIRLQAAVIQEDLKRVGIDLDVRSHEFATLYADVLKGNFQLFTLQWVGVSDPDMLRRVFHSQQMPPSGFNRGYYQNPEVDRLIDAAMAAESDEERRKLYGDAQRVVAEDAPYISLWYKTNIAVFGTNVEGVTLTPTAEFTFLRNVSKRNHPAAGAGE
jgi:peptide/nickel transport system substrate-binding protein